MVNGLNISKNIPKQKQAKKKQETNKYISKQKQNSKPI